MNRQALRHPTPHGAGRTRARAAVLAGMGVLCAASMPAVAKGRANAPSPAAQAATQAAREAAGTMTMDQFLDRLMMAESGGHAFAKNPRSTAVGPFQFIASTWLQVVRNSFGAEVAKLKPHEVLDLRTQPAFARRVARQYTEDNAAYLAAQGHTATFTNLRLAFLVGPGGAARVLSAKSEAPVAGLLGATVIGANPFMSNMTAEDLIGRAARDIATDVASTAGVTPDAAAVKSAGKKRRATPKVAVNCNLSLPSCRRWLALATKKVQRQKRASRD